MMGLGAMIACIVKVVDVKNIFLSGDAKEIGYVIVQNVVIVREHKRKYGRRRNGLPVAQ